MDSYMCKCFNAAAKRLHIHVTVIKVNEDFIDFICALKLEFVLSPNTLLFPQIGC